MSAALDLTPLTELRREEVDASPPPGARRDRMSAGASTVLVALSLLLVWALLYLFVLSGLEQGRAQSALYQDLRTQLAEGTAPTEAPIDPGAPVALLSIPDAGVEDAVVVEGTRPEQLQDGPGHQLGSVLPGQQSVSVIAGRSLSFGAPFRDIASLDPGDAVTVTTGQGTFTYRVIGVRRPGDPVPPTLEAGDGRLTLRTTLRSGLSASDVVFVDADLTDGAVPARTKAAPDPDTGQVESRGGTTTLALLALALQVFVLSLVGFAWAWSRWSRTGAWIAAGPCVVGALWLCSSLGSRLLPGLV